MAVVLEDSGPVSVAYWRWREDRTPRNWRLYQAAGQAALCAGIGNYEWRIVNLEDNLERRDGSS